jgi:hypothetical protein
MKRNPLLVSIGAAVMAVMASASVSAQTCAAPTSWNPTDPSSAANTVTGDLCALSDSVALYCGGLDSAAKNDAIYQGTFTAFGAADRTFTQITVSGGGGYTPVTYVYSGGCATGDGCVGSGEAAVPIPNDASIGAGTFFIAVSAAASDAPAACGTYTMVAEGGSFPVSMQSFSVE